MGPHLALLFITLCILLTDPETCSAHRYFNRLQRPSVFVWCLWSSKTKDTCFRTSRNHAWPNFIVYAIAQTLGSWWQHINWSVYNALAGYYSYRSGIGTNAADRKVSTVGNSQIRAYCNRVRTAGVQW